MSDLAAELYDQLNESPFAGKSPEDKEITASKKAASIRKMKAMYMIVQIDGYTGDDTFIRTDPDPQWVVVNISRRAVVDWGYRSYAEAAAAWYGEKGAVQEAFAGKTPEDMEETEAARQAVIQKAREADKENKWYKVTKTFSGETQYEYFYVRATDEDDAENVLEKEELYDPDETESGEDNEHVRTTAEQIDDDDAESEVPDYRYNSWKKFLEGKQTSIYEGLASKTADDLEDTKYDNYYKDIKVLSRILDGGGDMLKILKDVKEYVNGIDLGPEPVEEAFTGKSDEDKKKTADEGRENAELACLCHIYVPQWKKTLDVNYGRPDERVHNAQDEVYRILSETLPQGWIVNIHESVSRVNGVDEKPEPVQEAFGFAGKTDQDKDDLVKEQEEEARQKLLKWADYYKSTAKIRDKEKFDAIVKKFCEVTGVVPKYVHYNPDRIEMPENMPRGIWDWGFGPTHSGLRTHAYAIKLQGQAEPMWVYSTQKLADQVLATINKNNLQTRRWGGTRVEVQKRLTTFTYEAIVNLLDKRNVEYDSVAYLDSKIRESRVDEALAGKTPEDKEETAKIQAEKEEHMFHCPRCKRALDQVTVRYGWCSETGTLNTPYQESPEDGSKWVNNIIEDWDSMDYGDSSNHCPECDAEIDGLES